jgi:hypothetical protein
VAEKIEAALSWHHGHEGELGNKETDSATPAAAEIGDVILDGRTMRASCRETQG